MISIGAILLIGICLALLVTWYHKSSENSKKSFNVWAEQNVKYIVPKFPFNIFKMDLMRDEIRHYKEFGRIYGRFDGVLPVLTIGERVLIDRVMNKDFNKFPNRRDIRGGDPTFDNTLFALEGEDWKRVRSIVKIGFTHSSLKRMLTLLQECSDRMTQKFSQSADKGEVVNCQQNFSDYVLHSIARCAFGIKINDNDPFIENANKLFTDSWKTYLAVFAPKLMKYFKVTLLNAKTTKFYNDLMSSVIDERRRMENKKCNDFLQRMLDCEQKEDSNNNTEVTGKLTHDELLAQCVTFFMAGYETTISLLSHCVYQLAMNPDCQEKVIDEINRHMNDENLQYLDEVARNEVIFNSLGKLKYLDAVIKECFRLAPAMARIERRAEEDYTFPDTEIHVKKGYLVSIPVLAIHQDPEYYPNPAAFQPERFYQCERKEHNSIFFPFGSGARECIGKNFVDIQTKLCLTNVLRNFQVLPAPTCPVNLKLIETRNVLKVDNVDVILKRR